MMTGTERGGESPLAPRNRTFHRESPMRMRILAGLVALIGLVPTLSADDKVEMPLKNAKLGEWVEYKLTAQGVPQPIAIRQTVTDRTETDLTVKIETSMGGVKQPTKTKVLPLSKPYDPLKMLQDEAGPFRGEVKMGKTGSEVLKLNGREFKTTWSEAEMSGEVLGKKIVTKLKVWQTKDVALSGMVKMDLKTDNMGATSEMNMEFAGTGVDKIDKK